MTTCLVLLLAWGADPTPDIPKGFADFFGRSEAMRDAKVRSLTSQSVEYAAAIASESGSKQKAALIKKKVEIEKSLSEAKRAKYFAPLPEKPEPGDVGVFNLEIRNAIPLDEQRVVLQTAEFSFVLTKVDTKTIKDVVWQVVPTTASIQLTTKNKTMQPIHVLEPVKKGDIEKYRLQHEANRKPKVAE